MKKLLALIVLLAGFAFAAVKQGENILINGSLETLGVAPEMDGNTALAPTFWTPTRFVQAFEYKQNGALDGKGTVKLFAPTPGRKTPEVTVNQSDLTLVEGEKYRLSAMVRTKDFTAVRSGIVVMNNGWAKDAGIYKFPKDQEWTLMSTDIQMMASSNGKYGFAIYAIDFEGSIEFADFKLEALSPLALEKSAKNESSLICARPHLIPWSPRLNAITVPSQNAQGPRYPEMTFLFFGILPEGTTTDDYVANYSINGKQGGTAPIRKGLVTFQFKDNVTPGDFDLTVNLAERKTGNVIYTRTHSATFIEQPEINTSGYRRLNNLVVELLNKPIYSSKTPTSFDFCTFRNGWLFIAAENAKTEALEVVLDGKQTVITAKTDRQETFREVSKGHHKLTVKGAAAGGRLIVRSIPEIYSYAPGTNSRFDTIPPYDWEFLKRYELPAVTTLNGGKIPQEHRKEFFDAGYKWIANINTSYDSAEAIAKKLDNCYAFTSTDFQGVSLDEQTFLKLSSIIPFAEGLKIFKPKTDRNIYNWVANCPNAFGIHHDFIAESLNTAHGNGRILTEVYNPTKETYEDAMAFLDDRIVKTARSYRNFYPGILDQWGIILGAYDQVPIISLGHHPNVDFKYYLDLQFNIIANHPDCQDMGITGYWGSYHSTPELHRWCFMLTRHYCVEGKKNMLSEKYGYSYSPEHIKNGDFVNSCEHWTIQGNVAAGKQPQFGLKVQDRYEVRGGIGDTFAVFTKNDAEVSSVTQIARNLVPGRTYCLQFFTADYNDVKANRIDPKQNGLNATLGDGAVVDASQSWVFVDRRKDGRYAHNNGVARGNLHNIVFKATKPEVAITIDNAKAAKGDVLCCNYVSLNLFLEDNLNP